MWLRERERERERGTTLMVSLSRANGRFLMNSHNKVEITWWGTYKRGAKQTMKRF